MSRLTKIDGIGLADLTACFECHNCGNDNEHCGMCDKPGEAFERLAAYEKIGAPETFAQLVTHKKSGELLDALEVVRAARALKKLRSFEKAERRAESEQMSELVRSGAVGKGGAFGAGPEHRKGKAGGNDE